MAYFFGGAHENVKRKWKIMNAYDINVVDSPAEIGKTMAEVNKKKKKLKFIYFNILHNNPPPSGELEGAKKKGGTHAPTLLKYSH